MILPSKKLLTEVLGKENYQERFELIDPSIYGNDLRYRYDKMSQDYISINIYELMHFMKEWAWKNDYILASRKVFFGEWSCRVTKKLESEATNPKLVDIYLYDTEFEAVVKACTYILNSTKQ